MNSVTEIKSRGIYAALAAAQMQMGKALKSAANPHFKSKYADLAEVADACMPALNSNGIAVIQPIREQDGKLYAVTILAHEGGETLECPVPLIVQKNDMQGLGSAITYARRYGLMSMAGIAPEDDDGNAAAKSAPEVDTQAKIDERNRHDNAVGQACAYLETAETLDDLAAHWKNLPTAVKADVRVIKAKDDAKAALSEKLSNSDLAGDKIPY